MRHSEILKISTTKLWSSNFIFYTTGSADGVQIGFQGLDEH